MRVEGQLVFNGTARCSTAALAGFGLAYVPEDAGAAASRQGPPDAGARRLVPALPGYHLYYPSRRQPSAAFALLVDALRYRGRRETSDTSPAATRRRMAGAPSAPFLEDFLGTGRAENTLGQPA